jgi:rubrerythrin
MKIVSGAVLAQDDEYEYKVVKVQKNKRRVWRCTCGTELISYPLDADTFGRIPNFDGCPICGKNGKLVKVK